MALTPEDVVNKRFQPTKFREGYDQDEVDDFLDEVVVELRRLGQENDELREQLAAAQKNPVAASDSSRDEDEEEEAAAAEAPAEPKPASHMAPAAEAPAETAAQPAEAPSELDEAGEANDLLQLAKRLHDEHVRNGQEKRDALIAEGEEKAARIVAEAETLQREKITALESQRSHLEQRIEELRTFERDYRTQLRGYIEGQLRELDSERQNSSTVRPAAAAGAQGARNGSGQGAFQGFSA